MEPIEQSASCNVTNHAATAATLARCLHASASSKAITSASQTWRAKYTVIDRQITIKVKIVSPAREARELTSAYPAGCVPSIISRNVQCCVSQELTDTLQLHQSAPCAPPCRDRTLHLNQALPVVSRGVHGSGRVAVSAIQQIHLFNRSKSS